ncbi:Hok/Gef family protein [Actinophytocola sp.]|uniref:Hok/Gef family protein n=1 Tax=Actinophytocola sp. TaxID=1872138 RepID=UPI002ED3B18F
MTHTLLLVTHIGAGLAGLLLGPVVMIWHRAMTAYVAAVLVVCLTAIGLVLVVRPDLWWLIPVSALTLGLALVGRASERRRFRGWTHGYVHGLGGSYIAQVTALVVVWLVVNGPVQGPAQLIPWLAPTAVGTVLIEIWRRGTVVRWQPR